MRAPDSALFAPTEWIQDASVARSFTQQLFIQYLCSPDSLGDAEAAEVEE